MADRAKLVPAGDNPSVDDIFAALIGSNVLETLEITNDDLARARSDSDLLATLTITYELLLAFDDSHVLETFFHLPGRDQAKFLRWIGATDDVATRSRRTEAFISALSAAPLVSEEPPAEVSDRHA